MNKLTKILSSVSRVLGLKGKHPLNEHPRKGPLLKYSYPQNQPELILRKGKYVTPSSRSVNVTVGYLASGRINEGAYV